MNFLKISWEFIKKCRKDILSRANIWFLKGRSLEIEKQTSEFHNINMWTLDMSEKCGTKSSSSSFLNLGESPVSLCCLSAYQTSKLSLHLLRNRTKHLWANGVASNFEHSPFIHSAEVLDPFRFLHNTPFSVQQSFHTNFMNYFHFGCFLMLFIFLWYGVSGIT